MDNSRKLSLFIKRNFNSVGFVDVNAKSGGPKIQLLLEKQNVTNLSSEEIEDDNLIMGYNRSHNLGGHCNYSTNHPVVNHSNPTHIADCYPRGRPLTTWK